MYLLPIESVVIGRDTAPREGLKALPICPTCLERVDLTIPEIWFKPSGWPRAEADTKGNCENCRLLSSPR